MENFEPILSFIEEVDSRYESDKNHSLIEVMDSTVQLENQMEENKKLYKKMSLQGRNIFEVKSSEVEKAIDDYQYLIQRGILSNLGKLRFDKIC